jgi:two-component sensor histidine kinase
VPFDEIVGSLIKMAEDAVVVPRHVGFEVHGELGDVPADVATPLAVVLAELVQNAIEHAFAELDADAECEDEVQGQGLVEVCLANDGSTLRLEVTDNGSGLPEEFDIDASESLGLSIVRDLVRSQLDGTIIMRDRSASDASKTGTSVTIELPVREAQPIGR